jgi:hypothetical protein
MFDGGVGLSATILKVSCLDPEEIRRPMKNLEIFCIKLDSRGGGLVKVLKHG